MFSTTLILLLCELQMQYLLPLEKISVSQPLSPVYLVYFLHSSLQSSSDFFFSHHYFYTLLSISFVNFHSTIPYKISSDFFHNNFVWHISEPYRSFRCFRCFGTLSVYIDIPDVEHYFLELIFYFPGKETIFFYYVYYI